MHVVPCVVIFLHSRGTVLHAAVDYECPDSLPQLLTSNVDPAAVNSEGFTALDLACVCNETACAQLLLAHCKAADSADLYRTAVYAAAGGCVEVLRTLVQDHNLDLNTVPLDCSPLHAAAAWHRLDCVSYLLSLGIRSDQEAYGLTASAVALMDTAALPAGLKFADKLERPEDDDDDDDDVIAGNAVVALLLTFGAAVDPALMDPDNKCVPSYVAKLRSELKEARATLQILHSSMQEPDASQPMQSAAAEPVSDSADTVKLQLVHATSGVRGATLYRLDLALLASLHERSGSELPSVLMNLVQPPEGFAAGATASTTSAELQLGAAPVRLLKYDGK